MRKQIYSWLGMRKHLKDDANEEIQVGGKEDVDSGTGGGYGAGDNDVRIPNEERWGHE